MLFKNTFRMNAADDAVDAKILGWKHDGISWDARLMAARSARAIEKGMKPGRSKIDYQTDVGSLGWKAYFYSSKEHGDVMHLASTLSMIGDFAAVCPDIAVREYGNFFFHAFVRSDPPKFISPQDYGLHTARFLDFLERNADQAPEAVGFELRQYLEDPPPIFSKDDVKRIHDIEASLPARTVDQKHEVKNP